MSEASSVELLRLALLSQNTEAQRAAAGGPTGAQSCAL